MKRTLSRLTLAAACLSLAGSARAGFTAVTAGPLSVHPESMPTVPSGVTMPTLPSQPPAAEPTPSVAADHPAVAAFERAAMGFSDSGGFQPGASHSNPASPSIGQQQQAAARAFDGARAMEPADDLDGSSSWYDQHTGRYETQQTKLAKAYQLAMSHPLASAIKNAMPQNTVYKADNSGWSSDVGYVARTYGDDPEHANEPAVVVFKSQALQQLSVASLAAHLAKMWTFHMYRNKVPASAEKTYMGHSVMIRVFQSLTASQGQQYWNYNQDLPTWNSVGERTFEIFSHWYHWAKGFSFQNVRQGPYFLNKIMHAEGDPTIDTDARGRMTLHQREQAGQITGEQATNAQSLFDGFVTNER